MSKSVITIADRDEMFGLLESARTDICLMFLSVDLCCVLVSFDAGLLWRGCPDVQASCKSENPKRPVMQQMFAAFVACFCAFSISDLFFQTISSIRPS